MSPELCSIQRRKRVHIFILVNMWTDVQIKNRPAFCFRIWRVEEKSRRHDTRFCFVHFKVDCFTFQWLLRTIYCQLSLCSLDKFGLFFKELDLCDLRRNSLSGWFYIVWNNRHFPLRHQQKHTNCSAEIDSCSCFAAVTETRSHSLNVITLFSCRTSSHLKRFLFVLSCFVFQTWTFPPAAVSLTADEVEKGRQTPSERHTERANGSPAATSCLAQVLAKCSEFSRAEIVKLTVGLD